jgi:hypothetical protein
MRVSRIVMIVLAVSGTASLLLQNSHLTFC